VKAPTATQRRLARLEPSVQQLCNRAVRNRHKKAGSGLIEVSGNPFISLRLFSLGKDRPGSPVTLDDIAFYNRNVKYHADARTAQLQYLGRVIQSLSAWICQP
jgi:hypothetical protein